jgi:hypothetical protein
MDRKSWDNHGRQLSVELSNLNIRLANLGFKNEELNLPSGNKLVAPWELGLKSSKKIEHWNHTSWIVVAVQMDFQEPGLDLVLTLKVWLDSEVWRQERLERTKSFSCYQSVGEDVWQQAQENIAVMQTQSLEGAFERNRWWTELNLWLDMGFVPSKKKLRCMKISSEFSSKGRLDPSSMKFVDEVLSGPKCGRRSRS